MINKCHYWQLTMNYYYDIVCLMLEMAWIILQCTQRLWSATLQGDKHFSRWQAARFVTSDPAHCHGGDGSVSCGSADSSPCSEHSALRLATSLCRCFSANLWHPSTELKLTGPWEAGRELDISTDLWGQSGLQGGRSSSQPTCLYYIVLTKSLCLTTPFLYSNGETLLVYVFDICTNAPLWKRKWNLDISGINGQLAFLFE